MLNDPDRHVPPLNLNLTFAASGALQGVEHFHEKDYYYD